jgi:hypothetical protein
MSDQIGRLARALTQSHRPACSKCGSRMFLARIQPREGSNFLHTYECPDCPTVDQYVVGDQPTEPWIRLKEA